MADIKKSVNLLPEYLQTDKNSKFLSSTIDQLIQTPQVERLEGFVGSKITPNYNPATDFYIDEKSTLRNNYSLEPALIFRDSNSNVTDVVSYDDLINEIGIQGGKTSNLDDVFNSKFYSYDPLIDWDKLVNFICISILAPVVSVSFICHFCFEIGGKKLRSLFFALYVT